MKTADDWSDRDAAVAAWMAQLARTPLDASPMPSSFVLWRKAELLQRGMAEQRSAAAHALVDVLPLAIGLGGSGLLLVQLWSASSSLSPTLLGPILTTCAVGCGAVVLFAALGRRRFLMGLFRRENDDRWFTT